MGAQLFVEMHMRPFAEQVEIEIRQDRRKTVRILDFDLPFAITRPHAVAAQSFRQTTLEQTGVVNASQIAFVPLLVDQEHSLCFREKNAYDGEVALEMRTEIAEWIGMATLENRIGFWCKQGHSTARSERESIRQVPANGTRNQFGRCASSYSIS